MANSSMKPDPDKIKDYWNKLEPNIESMLGGYQSINRTDYNGSIKLLNQYFKRPEGGIEETCSSALDVGCGIGRVTRFVLSKFFSQIDLLEQEKQFLDKCPEYIGEELYKKKVGRTFNCSMASWVPDANHRYDLIWLQWAVAYLDDDQLLEFLLKCKSSLKPDTGYMVIKDNVTSQDQCDNDTIDFSTTRPLRLLIEIIIKSGFSVVEQVKQTKFPRGLYPVYMIVLK